MERAFFIRVLIDAQCGVEGVLERRCRALDIHQRAVGVRGGDSQPLRLRKGDHSRVILFGRTKLLRELLRCQETPVVRAGRIVNLAQQVGERRLIAQRQAERCAQPVGGRQPVNRLQRRCQAGKAVTQYLPVGRFQRRGSQQKPNGHEYHRTTKLHDTTYLQVHAGD